MKIELPVEITPENVYRGLSREELLDFIHELDIRVAEMDFTLRLITLLINSIQNDMTGEEYHTFIDQFKLTLIKPEV
jgi:hypothetical protein